MIFTIIQIERTSSTTFIELPVRTFDDRDTADKFLARLAKKQGWKFKKGRSIDKYIDTKFLREYYVTDRNII